MVDPVRVLVADDHELVRHGTCDILDASPEIDVVGEATDGAEAIDLVERFRPDVVLMDVRMPVVNGAEATRRIRALFPDTRVIALTIHNDEEYVIEMLEAGASGYLLKDVRDHALIDAVRSVAAGEVVLHPAVASAVLARIRLLGDGGTRPAEHLTDREQEVLRMAAAGRSNREIGDRLGLSARTVEVHLGRSFRKLGVRTRTEAAMECVRRGLIDVEDR